MTEIRQRKVTEQDIDCLQDVFNLFDSNKDGEITIAELDKVMRSHGIVHSTSELEEMVFRVDTNSNGSVDFDEFVDLVVSHNGVGVEEGVDDDIAQVFKMFDKDGNGKISADEVRSTMKELGENLTPQEVKAMISEADIDGDGQIDIHEFSRLMECFGK